MLTCNVSVPGSIQVSTPVEVLHHKRDLRLQDLRPKVFRREIVISQWNGVYILVGRDR